MKPMCFVLALIDSQAITEEADKEHADESLEQTGDIL